MKRRKLITPVLFAIAIATGPGIAQQAPDGEAVTRKQPEAQSFQDEINDVFGAMIGGLTYYPFYNIASWFGLDTAPQYVRDEKGEPIAAQPTSLEGHTGAVSMAMFAPDGGSVLTVDAEHTVRLFDLGGKVLASFKHPAAVSTAAFFPGGGEFATGCADGNVRIFPTAAAEGEAFAPKLTITPAHAGGVTHVSYSPDGTWLASHGADGTVKLWDAAGAQKSAFNDIAALRTLAITSDTEQDEELVFILDGNGDLQIAKANGTNVKKIEGQNIVGLQVAADETHVLVKMNPSAFKLITADGTEKGVIQLAEGTTAVLSSIGEVADGGEIEVLDDKGTRHWFNAEGEATRSEENSASSADGYFTTENAEPNSIALTHHRSADVEAGVWVLKGHSGPVTGSSMAPDGTRVVTWSQDGTARIWEWFVRGPDGNPVQTNIPFVVLWLVLAAVFFTVYMKFVNLRMFGHALQVVRGKFSNPEDTGEVTHFQALASALSATVGLGNIAGVAIAVSVGGPGATFWMIVAGLLGMTLKFTECTLGQKFRKIDSEGRVSGGPMHYLKEGLQQKGLGIIGVPIALIFTVFCIGGSLAGGNAFQVNQSADILKGQVPFFAEHPWVYGVGLAILVGIVIIGGIKRIAQTAEKIVPTMCGIYVLAALTILVMNIDAVPGAFSQIFGSALSGDAMYGGALGSLIMGFRRAAFSNEAGVGSASIAHSAARTPYAVREGIVALLEPFIDTVVVCTMTALVIVITGVYNAEKFPELAPLVAGNNGAGLTANAFSLNPVLAGWFPWVLMVAVILFAFSTMISWSYYGERCWTNIFGPKSSLSFKVLFLVFTVLGSIVSATNVLEFGDVMILLMAFPNILGLYFLGGLVKTDLSEYEEKMRAGEFKAYK